MKIGILGGSFDPPHGGHIELAKIALEHLDELIVVPAFLSPFKAAGAATADQRLKMARLAFLDLPRTTVSDYEINCKQPVPSYQTLEHFQSIYKDSQIVFVVGSDSLYSLDKWAEQERLKRFSFLAVRRPFYTLDLERRIKELDGFNIELTDEAGIYQSSTLVRLAISIGKECQHMPICLYEYIKQNELYLDFKPYVDALDMYNLSEERKEHIKQVAIYATKLAMHHGANVFDAALSGLLHDIAKRTTLLDAQNMGLEPPKSLEKISKNVVHASIGALIAKKVFSVYNRDILNAIRYHTTGRAKMSLLEKIVYIADLIEPARDFEGIELLRRLAFTDIDRAVYYSLERKINHAKKKHYKIDSRSIAALEYYKNLVEVENGREKDS